MKIIFVNKMKMYLFCCGMENGLRNEIVECFEMLMKIIIVNLLKI